MEEAPCTILWSTQGGRAKACARRAARIMRDTSVNCNLPPGYSGSSFDDYGAAEFFKLGKSSLSGAENDERSRLIIMFVSTTGDAEHCDNIKDTWGKLLQKSVPRDQFQNVQFAIFCLGDRAYGPSAFCAAGRKMAARMVQLGAKPFCDIGYGDDGTPNGGVFNDLDVWLENIFLDRMFGKRDAAEGGGSLGFDQLPQTPYCVKIANINHVNDTDKEWQRKQYEGHYGKFFASSCPATSYHYSDDDGRRVLGSEDLPLSEDPLFGKPLKASVVSNDRITSEDWVQDTRHIRLHVATSITSKSAPFVEKDARLLPYKAGDIATVVPSNPKATVARFISCLPATLKVLADEPLEISTDITSSTQYSTSFTPWPKHATLRGILTYCADIGSLPEREDLRALSYYCNPNHPVGLDQRKKLISLSETSDAALYGDYILREKRNWGDILFDFDSIMFESDNGGERKDKYSHFVPLTIEHLLMILSPIMPRHFSIASAPSQIDSTDIESARNDRGYTLRNGKVGFQLDLCVAVVEGQTRYGRQYQGLCSVYLSCLKPTSRQDVRIWIRPGSFGKLPLQVDDDGVFETPVMCVGAGTGVAPLRSLLQERQNARILARTSVEQVPLNAFESQNILVFGCRKSSMDFYYEKEWEEMKAKGGIRVLSAFSQDQNHKLYVQKVLREADEGTLIARHILENNGCIYIAGGAKMARAVKDEIVECLGKILPTGEKGAKVLLLKLQRAGRFSVEAWS